MKDNQDKSISFITDANPNVIIKNIKAALPVIWVMSSMGFIEYGL